MATIPVWVGSAPSISQVETDTFSVTWIIGEKITITVGSKAYAYLITSTVIATFLPLLSTALNALDTSLYPEFAEITWLGAGTTLTATAKTPGKPFTYSISTNSAAGVITPAATTASSGPEDWSAAANWSLGAVPLVTDTVIIDREGASIRYGLPTAGPTLGSIRCIARKVTLGLPETNSDGTPYAEYRNTSLAVGCTTFYMNSPSCQRFKINFLAVQTTVTVDATGSGAEPNVPAFLAKGTHASNVFTFNSGSWGLGFFSSVATTANILNLGAGSTGVCGAGCTINTVNNYGGTVTFNSAIVTALNHPSTASAKSTLYGSGAIAQVNIQGGTVALNGTGTLNGNTVVGGSGFLTVDGGTAAMAITNPVLLESKDAGFSDALGRVTTGAVISMVNCASSRLGIKPNSKLTITYL